MKRCPRQVSSTQREARGRGQRSVPIDDAWEATVSVSHRPRALSPKTSALAKELDAVHQESDERETQMAALTKALSEAGLGLR